MIKKIANKLKGFFGSERVQMFCMMMVVGSVAMFAQNAAGNYEAGTTALTTVTEEIAKYVPIVVKLCYAIAAEPQLRKINHKQDKSDKKRYKHERKITAGREGGNPPGTVN